MTLGTIYADNNSIDKALGSKNIEETMDSLRDKQPYPAQNMCEKHCNITYSLVRIVALDPFSNCSDEGYSLKFRFDKEVVFSKEVISYTIYNFLVDIGGLMGLWLGKHYK